MEPKGDAAREVPVENLILERCDGYAMSLPEGKGVSIFATVETTTTHVPGSNLGGDYGENKE